MGVRRRRAHTPVTADLVTSTFVNIAATTAPRLDADRQRPRLRRPLRGWEERLRVPAGTARHHPDGHPATRRPRARSSASTRPSSAGSPNSNRPRPSPSCNTSSTPSALSTTNQRPHRELARRTPGHGLRSATQGIAHRTPPRALPDPLRPPRRPRQDELPPSRPDAPPRRRPRPRPRQHVLAIADDNTVTVIVLETGEILSTHQVQPEKNYWRNTQRAPGRWPGTQ